MNLSIFLLQLALVATIDPPKFEEQTIDDQVQIGYGIAIGDVDGDGKPDILLADKQQFVWYRNGDWKRFVMVDQLTSADNVTITARDINGDGQVEVAVGARWNPGEVSNTDKSGSVHYLIRPEDPTQLWTPVELHHEPTVHRMRWVKADEGKYHLIVLPLHGRGNQNGEGAGVKVIAYEMPEDPTQAWKYWTIDESMHLTHNMDLVEEGDGEKILVGGKEGIKSFSFTNEKWRASESGEWRVKDQSFGEVRQGSPDNDNLLVGIQPMHGNTLSVYTSSDNQRTVLTTGLNQGHALAVADLLGQGKDQIVAGWRDPNDGGKVGIKLFISTNKQNTTWEEHWIDENGMACEDLQVADLNGDGRMDIIAAGRATNNLKIYWNHSGQ